MFKEGDILERVYPYHCYGVVELDSTNDNFVVRNLISEDIESKDLWNDADILGNTDTIDDPLYWISESFSGD